jgi:mitogen-activated protein kinase kinase kinase
MQLGSIEMLYYKNISVYFVELPATHQWTPETVQLWLKENNFSDSWIETFKHLNIYGLAFLDLGFSWRLSKLGDYGPYGIMHQQVYPRLARECAISGTGWDQAREQEEGRRMGRLIRHATGSSIRRISRRSY